MEDSRACGFSSGELPSQGLNTQRAASDQQYGHHLGVFGNAPWAPLESY